MSFAKIEFDQREEAFQSNKHLITNMNTNNSLALSQTLAQADFKKEESKNIFIQTKQTNFTQKSTFELPIYSRKKDDYSQNQAQASFSSKKGVTTLVESLKMISFLNQQTIDRKRYIQRKSIALRKLQKQVLELENRIKIRKVQYQIKLAKFQQKNQRLKNEKKDFNKRIVTQISDYKIRISSIRRRSSINPSNIYGTRQLKSKRSSENRVYTQRSEEKKVYIPLQYGFEHNRYQQIYQRTLPLTSKVQDCTLFPNQFRRSDTDRTKIQIHPNKQNPQQLIKIQCNQVKRQSLCQSSKPVRQNLFDILGKHFRFPQTISSIESLTVQKIDESMIQSLNDSKISKQGKKNSFSKKFQEQKIQKSQILDQQTVNMLYDNDKQFLPLNKEKMNKSKNQNIIFLPSEFKIVNMGDSVQSQFTQTERQFQAIKKVKFNESLKISHKSYQSIQSLSQTMNAENDDIIDSIKLTSHSRIYKQKLAQSKYLPNSTDPQNFVQNSALLDLNLLAESNISRKRADNSKKIKKNMQSLKLSGNSLKEKSSQQAEDFDLSRQKDGYQQLKYKPI